MVEKNGTLEVPSSLPPVNGIEIGTICIPKTVVEDITRQTKLTREDVSRIFFWNRGPVTPLNLGCEVPWDDNIYKLLICAIQQRYIARFPAGHSTYINTNMVPGDPNAFRGDLEYLRSIQSNLEKWGLKDIPFNQIITGTQGGQDLTTNILGYLFHTENRRPVLTSLTYDRVINFIVSELNLKKEEIQSVKDSPKGVDIEDLKKEFSKNKDKGGSVLYLVLPGKNPDGYTIPPENLSSILELAEKENAVILIDAAYLELFFDEENKYKFPPNIKDYINNGTLIIVRSATKEGGERGCAYAVGGEQRITKILENISNKRLAPDYETEIRSAMIETLPLDDPKIKERLRHFLLYETQNQNARFLLDELNSRGMLSMEDFRKMVIRPNLKAGFKNIKKILAEAKIALSDADVTHGYNVNCLLPPDSTKEQQDKFFAQLGRYGVIATDLSAFTVGEKFPSGFRISFGSYSPQHCAVIATIIAAAYKKTFN